ncbi:MAG: hypothetical protein JXR75_04080 [Rhodobacteraceae bacterium]|nr:hypothetical protein [Paracoccaceae bacterium]
MQKQTLVDDLAEIRAQIDRLRQRAARIEAALARAEAAAPATPPRPGWPIQRIRTGTGASFH